MNNCPRCGQEMIENRFLDLIECPDCGYEEEWGNLNEAEIIIEIISGRWKKLKT